jgi:hypothetical protein
MKTYFLLLLAALLLNAANAGAQDTLQLHGGDKIPVYKLKVIHDHYHFYTTTSSGHKIKSRLLLSLVDSVKRLSLTTDTLATSKRNRKNKGSHQETAVSTNSNENTDPPARIRAWKYNNSVSLGLGNNMELNDPTGLPDKSGFSIDFAWDASAQYTREGRSFSSTHELHTMFSIQKQGLSRGTHLQIAQDNLSLLHDISWTLKKNKKWNLNFIIKSGTAVFTCFDGSYFKNHTGLGRVKSFASPYDITVSPGIKFQPSGALRISVSPYSFNLFGVINDEIRNKGLHITDTDAGGNYKKNLYRRLGAEINCWFDKEVNGRLQLQYRLGISANYFEQITRNGLLDGLFITRIKLFRELYLTHRLSLKNTFDNNFFKPFVSQNILLSYAKSF